MRVHSDDVNGKIGVTVTAAAVTAAAAYQPNNSVPIQTHNTMKRKFLPIAVTRRDSTSNDFCLSWQWPWNMHARTHNPQNVNNNFHFECIRWNGKFADNRNLKNDRHDHVTTTTTATKIPGRIGIFTSVPPSLVHYSMASLLPVSQPNNLFHTHTRFAGWLMDASAIAMCVSNYKLMKIDNFHLFD